MTTIRTSRRLVIGWLFVAMATLCQAPRLYGDDDPNCPSCAAKRQAEAAALAIQQMPIGAAAEFAQLEVPLVGTAVVHAEPECPVPVVRLRIKAPACAEVGKEMEYRIKVENNSPADAHNVVVKMSLPASIKVLRASPQIHQREPELQWNLGTMPGHGCHDIVVMIVPLGLADIKSCTRVTFEHGQCVTTKVMAFAPEGSADGKVPPGVLPGQGGPGGPGDGQGGLGARGDFDVRVFAPKEAPVGQPVTYKISVFNKSDRPIYKVGVVLEWGKDLEETAVNDDLVGPPGSRAWPKGLFEMLPAGSSKSLDLVLRSRGEGQQCLKASASASLSQNPADNRIVNAKDEACTIFKRGIPGMTLEMFDRDDPILKNGQTSYPITVRNQGTAPITNLTIKARVPDMLEVDQVRGPGKFRSGLDARKEFWVEYEPLATLNVGETQTFEISVKGKGQVGDARFHVEMTADQLDKGPNGATRWIIEEESTTIVPDEETRVRIREISRKMKVKDRTVPGFVTSGH